MSRVSLLDAETAPITTQQYFQDGDPGPIVAALATVPELVGPTLAFVGAALGAGAVGPRYKEFAVLRSSALQGCEYCIHAHTTVALDVGLTSTEVAACVSCHGFPPAILAGSESRMPGISATAWKTITTGAVNTPSM